MGSSPSNPKKSRATIASSDDPSRSKQTLAVPHVTRSNAAFSYVSTQFGSRVIDDDVTYPGEPLSEVQSQIVHVCLEQLEVCLGITFSDELTNCVQVVKFDNGKIVLSPQVSEGLFIVDHGALEVCTNTKQDPITRLLHGDFCGELSSLFGGYSSATVISSGQASCLFISSQDLQSHWLEGSLNKNAMFSWCIKRCYVDLTSLFAPDTLSRCIKCTALKSCDLFSDWSDEAISMMVDHMSIVLYSDGDEIIRRDHMMHLVFLLLRGSVTMVATDGKSQHKCVRSCDEGYALLEQEFFSGQPSRVGVSCTAPSLLLCVSRDDIVATVTQFPEMLSKLRDKISAT